MSDEKLLDGKKIGDQILDEVRRQVCKLDEDKRPGLSIILIGHNPSSELYVRLKKRACEYCDISFHSYHFDEDQKEEDILRTIEFLNNDPETDGILVQLPLPEKFETDKIIGAIDYRKDIDGFHPKNREGMSHCQYKVMPPLPMGIIDLVESSNQKIKDKKIVVFCNSKLFGDPFKCAWSAGNAVEVITTEDKDWKQQVAEADILIVSIGLPFFITKDMIKKGCTIIDVGINKLDNGEVVGDVSFADVLDKVAFISPVPGGVGPMTVAALLKNLLKLKELTAK